MSKKNRNKEKACTQAFKLMIFKIINTYVINKSTDLLARFCFFGPSLEYWSKEQQLFH